MSDTEPAKPRGRKPAASAASRAAPAIVVPASVAPQMPAPASVIPAAALVPAPEPIAPVVPELTPAAAPAIAEASAPVVAKVPAPAVAAEPTPAEAAPAVEAAVTPVPYVPAQLKGLFSMATNPETFTPKLDTAKVQAMFGDYSERAKTAFEKSQKFGEELGELTKGNLEAMVASAKVAAKGAETMGLEAAAFGKSRVESTTAVMKSFASVKSPTELFHLQSDFAKASFDSAVAETSKMSEAWVKLAGDMFQPLSSRYAVVAEKLKTIAA